MPFEGKELLRNEKVQSKFAGAAHILFMAMLDNQQIVYLKIEIEHFSIVFCC